MPDPANMSHAPGYQIRRAMYACYILNIDFNEVLCSIRSRNRGLVLQREALVWIMRHTNTLHRLSLKEIATILTIPSHSTIVTMLRRTRQPDELATHSLSAEVRRRYEWMISRDEPEPGYVLSQIQFQRFIQEICLQANYQHPTPKKCVA